MKKSTILIVAFLSIASAVCFAADTSNDDSIVAMEKKAWQSFKDRQGDAFKGLMASGYVSVYPDGIKDINGELADMKSVELRSFDLTDTKVTHPSADIAILTYKSNAQVSAAGKDLSGTYNCGSVYLKQNGKWLGIFHTETKAEK
jgi:hypothetical protein